MDAEIRDPESLRSPLEAPARWFYTNDARIDRAALPVTFAVDAEVTRRLIEDTQARVEALDETQLLERQ